MALVLVAATAAGGNDTAPPGPDVSAAAASPLSATMVHLSLVPGASGSAVQVSFSTPKASTGCSRVQYWPTSATPDANRTAMGRSVSYAKAVDTIHHVQLFSLEPGRSYLYTCGCASDSTVHHFVAPPPAAGSGDLVQASAEEPSTWSMLALADLGTYVSSNATLELMASDTTANYEWVLLGELA